MQPTRLSDVYRTEALEHRERHTRGGGVLRLTPAWGRYAYVLVVVMAASLVVFLALFRTDEYARGAGIVRLVGRIEHTAAERATVATVIVEAGQSVKVGDPLLELRSETERAELERMESELELALVRVLRDPSDAAAAGSLSKLRAERDLARRRLEARIVRASADGTVGDVRVRQGQKVESGDVLASVIGRDAYFELVVALPGSSRPLLGRGTPLRVELNGYPYAYLDVPLAAVSDDVIGPAEARRIFGPAMSESVSLDGAVVIAHARTDGPTFRANGTMLHFHDGMAAVAEARLRRESILVALVPSLRWSRERHGR